MNVGIKNYALSGSLFINIFLIVLIFFISIGFKATKEKAEKVYRAVGIENFTKYLASVHTPITWMDTKVLENPNTFIHFVNHSEIPGSHLILIEDQEYLAMIVSSDIRSEKAEINLRQVEVLTRVKSGISMVYYAGNWPEIENKIYIKNDVGWVGLFKIGDLETLAPIIKNIWSQVEEIVKEEGDKN